MAHTPQQGSRVRPHLPEASPFSSVLARLPDLSPPRTKYTTSFGSLHGPPGLASPAPQSTFGFRPPSGSQTPGGPNDGSKAVAFDLLASTPIKSIPPEQQLGSPRFDLQSPKFPLFQPSPKKPLDSLRSPPSVRLGDSTAPNVRSFSSPFGSLLDGSSRSAPSPADGAGAGPSPPPRGSASQPQRHQQRFAALFAQGGVALDAALGAGDIPLPSGLDPAYLSPLRPSSATGVPRRASSTGSGAAGGGADPLQHQERGHQAGAEHDEQACSQQHAAAALAAEAAALQEVGADAAEVAAVQALAAARGGSLDVAADMAQQQAAAAAVLVKQEAEEGQVEEEEDEEEDDEDEGMDDENDEDYTTSASFRRPPPRRHPATGAGAPGRQQQLFMPNQRPMRRRMLQFAAGSGAVAGPAGVAADEEVEATPLVHSTLPQSPMCQPVRMGMDVDMMLPIPKLRDPSSASLDGEDGGSGSPMHRLRSTGYSLDSPAVQAAAHAAVAAVLEASAAGTSSAAPGVSRRPARAAAAGAAAAAKAAAEAAGTPVQRRASSHLARTGSSGGGSLGSAPLTPDEGALPQAVFSGPKKCNCKKSKCLKLYCDCFANGGYCGPNCSCINCANKLENSNLVRAQREAIKQRNPNAFVQKIEADATLGGQHRRGCNCRKSHCMKKYCECFQAGVPCGEHCKCESCHNTAGHPGRRPPGGGASKRARNASTVQASQPRTRQASTRLAAGAATALSQQLKQAQAAAAASLQAAVAQAAAGLAGGSIGEGGFMEEAVEAAAAAVIKQEPQTQQPQLLFPLMPPAMLQAADGMSAPLMIPILLQHPGAHPAGAPPPLAPPPTASPALAAFAAAAAGPAPELPAAPDAAAGAGVGAVPSHITPVSSLLAPMPAAAAAAAPAGDQGAAPGPGFTFHPTPPSADGSGSSSGQSTPRAAAGRAAAAAADVAFSLDTPAATVAAAAAAGLPGAAAGSILDQLLPVAAANGSAAAEEVAAGSKGAAAATVAGGKPAPSGVRSTPTKRKPQRTMTAALM